MTKQSTGSKIYGGLSTFGAVMADMKAVVGSILGIVLIIVGIVLVRKKSIYTQMGTGIVLSNSCSDPSIQPSPVKDSKGFDINPLQYNWTCTLTVKNSDDKSQNPIKKTRQIDTVTSSSRNFPYPVNSTIPIYVNPNNQSDFDFSSDDTHVIGWVLIAIGPIMIIGSIVWAYFANKYKVIGAYEGVRTGVDIIRGGNY